MTKTLDDIAEAMRDIDFCTLSTMSADGGLASRPMSNNRKVAYTGDAWFFTDGSAHVVAEIAANPQVGTTYLGSPGLKGMFGAPGMFIHVKGHASLIRDKAQFAEHWDASLDRWFAEGIDTPGLVLIKVSAQRIHYWEGEDDAEIAVDLMPA